MGEGAPPLAEAAGGCWREQREPVWSEGRVRPREAGSPAWPWPTPPGEREALCPGWAAAEGGGEETGPFPSVVPSGRPRG